MWEFFFLKSPLIKISEEDLENLKLDAKLKKYEMSLRKSPLNGIETAESSKPGGDASGENTEAPTSASSNGSGSATSRPQFRVPFFFKSSN